MAFQNETVHLPAGKDQTLDLIITNLLQYSSSDFLAIHPPLGLSEHNVVTLFTKERSVNTKLRKSLKKGHPPEKKIGEIFMFYRLVLN